MQVYNLTQQDDISVDAAELTNRCSGSPQGCLGRRRLPSKQQTLDLEAPAARRRVLKPLMVTALACGTTVSLVVVLINRLLWSWENN